jgi:hypothetical protein
MANAAGQTLEGVIYDLLLRKGIEYDVQVTVGERSIFGKRIRVDVLILPCARFPEGLIIEAKWQDVTGTAEEKLPYLWLNIIEYYPYPTMIIIDGSGFSSGAIDWIKSKIDGKKLIAVKSVQEFMSWCNREL